VESLENVVTVSDDSRDCSEGCGSPSGLARWMMAVAAGALITGALLYFLRVRKEAQLEDPLGRIEQMLEQAQDLIRRIEGQFGSPSPELHPS
jgi:HAMP domain-containing protein